MGLFHGNTPCFFLRLLIHIYIPKSYTNGTKRECDGIAAPPSHIMVLPALREKKNRG